MQRRPEARVSLIFSGWLVGLVAWCDLANLTLLDRGEGQMDDIASSCIVINQKQELQCIAVKLTQVKTMTLSSMVHTPTKQETYFLAGE